MGWMVTYENEMITVYECDKCTKHSIIVHKRTGQECWVNEKGFSVNEKPVSLKE